ncbi:hypothetical protein XELAEV_18003791mg [Xenopus laevis]|uniref:Protein kinase domain-containing protein n=1 Tax=Xenopus laevis TaxID=8355 RepID=A0A974BPT7_XENLA|nr:hypothetical protein XELAEV_18003791mg [Xenopus laevis]
MLLIVRIMVEKRVALAAAVHPFTMDLHATFQSEHHLFFLMEYVAGGCLRTLLERERKFGPQRTTYVIMNLYLVSCGRYLNIIPFIQLNHK